MSTSLSTRRASRLSVSIAVVVLAVCLALPSSTWAQSSATVKALFAPNRLAAKGALTLTMHFAGDFGVPVPLRRALVRLPAGMGMSIPALRICRAARLRAHGAGGCPAQSEIGSGYALVEAHAGSQLIGERVALGIFLGPPQLDFQPTFEVLGEGRTPLLKRLVLGGTVVPGSPPYGETIVMNIPPIATLALEPDASIVTLSLTVGTIAHRLAAGANTVEVPRACPAGGFPFAGEFTYADGSTSSALATATCPRRK